MKRFLSLLLCSSLFLNTIAGGSPFPQISPLRPHIFHIKDVHQHEVTQTKIIETLNQLIRENSCDVIFLEGDSAQLDFTPYRQHPDRLILEQIGKFLLRNGKISGPALLGLTNQFMPPTYGIENKNIYEENIRAYRKVSFEREKLEPTLDKYSDSVNVLKNNYLNPPLLNFEKHFTAYKDGQESALPIIELFQSRVIELPQTLKDYLELAKNKKQDLQFDLDQFHDDMVMTSLNYRDMLIETKEEKDILNLGDRIDFWKKGVRLELTYAEWLILKEDMKPLLSVNQNVILLSKHLNDLESTKLLSISNFYEIAESRNDIFIKNVQQILKQSSFKNAVLITGGFHLPALKNYFNANNFSYQAITPNIQLKNSGMEKKVISPFIDDSSLLQATFNQNTLAPEPLPQTAEVQIAAATYGKGFTSRGTESQKYWAEAFLNKLKCSILHVRKKERKKAGNEYVDISIMRDKHRFGFHIHYNFLEPSCALQEDTVNFFPQSANLFLTFKRIVHNFLTRSYGSDQQVSFTGRGLHSTSRENGKLITVTVILRNNRNGIRFIRTDLKGKLDPLNMDNDLSLRTVEVNLDNIVTDSKRFTAIKKGTVFIQTPEHILSALRANGIWNADIEIDGEEVPILDGSTKIFFAGLKRIRGSIKKYPQTKTITEPIVFRRNDKTAVLLLPVPKGQEHSEYISVVNLEGLNSPDGKPFEFYFNFTSDQQYEKAIAPYPTFFEKPDLHKFQKEENLFLGALPGVNIRLTSTGEFIPKDLARHKILDAIGDLFQLELQPSVNGPLLCRAILLGSGHRDNEATASFLDNSIMTARRFPFRYEEVRENIQKLIDEQKISPEMSRRILEWIAPHKDYDKNMDSSKSHAIDGRTVDFQKLLSFGAEVQDEYRDTIHNYLSTFIYELKLMLFSGAANIHLQKITVSQMPEFKLRNQFMVEFTSDSGEKHVITLDLRRIKNPKEENQSRLRWLNLKRSSADAPLIFPEVGPFHIYENEKGDTYAIYSFETTQVDSKGLSIIQNTPDSKERQWMATAFGESFTMAYLRVLQKNRLKEKHRSGWVPEISNPQVDIQFSIKIPRNKLTPAIQFCGVQDFTQLSVPQFFYRLIHFSQIDKTVDGDTSIETETQLFPSALVAESVMIGMEAGIIKSYFMQNHSMVDAIDEAISWYKNYAMAAEQPQKSDLRKYRETIDHTYSKRVVTKSNGHETEEKTTAAEILPLIDKRTARLRQITTMYHGLERSMSLFEEKIMRAFVKKVGREKILAWYASPPKSEDNMKVLLGFETQLPNNLHGIWEEWLTIKQTNELFIRYYKLDLIQHRNQIHIPKRTLFYKNYFVTRLWSMFLSLGLFVFHGLTNFQTTQSTKEKIQEPKINTATKAHSPILNSPTYRTFSSQA